jgi:glycosyltransferase involved in cell wall biosynthesis
VEDLATMSTASPVELSIVMPCLNEAETVAECVGEALGWLEASGVSGEVIVADNGSTDGSQGLAAAAGARVVEAPIKGYGGAVEAGVAAAEGRFIITGDADLSYDFASLAPFVAELRDGADLVVGNRFQGGIEKGAMPWLHKYLGNPVLSWLGRLFFRVPLGDFHCGLRGFKKGVPSRLRMRSTGGFEYCAEMIVKAGLNDLDVREVPTVLRRDGRSRRPHLRTWRDGWRNLRFLLLYSPRWLFLVPGSVMFVIGLSLTVALVISPVTIGPVTLDVAALVYSAALTMIGAIALGFALFTKVYAATAGFLPRDHRLDNLATRFGLEKGLFSGFLLIVAGAVAAVMSFWRWRAEGFGDLDPIRQLRIVVPAALGLTLGLWVVLSSFFLSILGMDDGIDVG